VNERWCGRSGGSEKNAGGFIRIASNSDAELRIFVATLSELIAFEKYN
jgi:hypothetical protein